MLLSIVACVEIAAIHPVSAQMASGSSAAATSATSAGVLADDIGLANRPVRQPQDPGAGSEAAGSVAVPGVALSGTSVDRLPAAVQSAAAPSNAYNSSQASDAWRVWGAGSAAWSYTGGGMTGAAIRSEAQSATLGIERSLTPALLLGLALTGTSATTSSSGVHIDSQSYGGQAYTSWLPYRGWEFDAAAGLGNTALSSERQLTLNGVPLALRGSSQGLAWSFLAAGGYRFTFNGPYGQSFLKPFASLSELAQDRRGYAETSGPVSLFFHDQVFHRTTVNAGLAAGIDVPWPPLPGSWVLRPELAAAWSHYLVDPSPTVVANLNNLVSFGLKDPEPGRDGALVSAQLSLINVGRAQLFAGYLGEYRGNYISNGVRAGVRLAW